MFNNRTIEFCKSEACPTSYELFAFREGNLSERRSAAIRDHNLGCDFCAAELEFYQHFSESGDEKVQPSEIPNALYELAKALLCREEDDLSSLNQLLSEGDRLRTGCS